MGRIPPRRRRALIVEDEILIALDLEDAMSDLGFEVCPLASSDRNARSLAMRDQPDIVLVDVCLEGGREGIETARWLREVCGASVVRHRLQRRAYGRAHPQTRAGGAGTGQAGLSQRACERRGKCRNARVARVSFRRKRGTSPKLISRDLTLRNKRRASGGGASERCCAQATRHFFLPRKSREGERSARFRFKLGGLRARMRGTHQ